jgi:hypothetical protein
MDRWCFSGILSQLSNNFVKKIITGDDTMVFSIKGKLKGKVFLVLLTEYHAMEAY